MTGQVIVVGGGLGGALAARALDLAGIDVAVVDAGDPPGGVAVAQRRDGYLLEPAAGTISLPHPDLGWLLEGLHLSIVPADPAARHRLVYHHGRTHPVMPGPSLLSSKLISGAGKVRAAAEVLVPRRTEEEETLSGFMRRRFGPEAGELGAWLAAAGVYAGHPDRLSVQEAFPALATLERSHGSVVRGMLARRRAGGGEPPRPHVVEGGTAMVASAAAASLGERWMSGFEVERVRASTSGWKLEGPESLRAEQVVLAVPFPVASRLLDRTDDLGEAETAPVAVVWLGCTRPALPSAMGMLIGPDEEFETLGFLFESSYASSRAPSGRGLVKAIVGGATRPRAVDLADVELVGSVSAELERVLGSVPAVEMSHVVRHRPGIPQYTARRRGLLARLGRDLPAGLHLAGWAYHGVGVGQLATSAVNLAQHLATQPPIGRAAVQ